MQYILRLDLYQLCFRHAYHQFRNITRINVLKVDFDYYVIQRIMEFLLQVKILFYNQMKRDRER